MVVKKANKLVQPLKWHGGKHSLANLIIRLMEPHSRYVEPYAGGLSVLWAKDPKGIDEVVNDMNPELINFYRVLKDPELFGRFHRQLLLTPFSQVEFERAKQGSSSDPVQAAVLFFVRMRQGRQGMDESFATITRNRTRRGMNAEASAWWTAVADLPRIHQRLQRVTILNDDACKVIRQEDRPDTLQYCDPPYLHATRHKSATDAYDCEMTDEQHQELLDTLGSIKGKFILSGYWSPMYAAAAQKYGWECDKMEIPNSASGAKKKEIKVECLWRNF